MYSRKTCAEPTCNGRALPNTEFCAKHCDDFENFNQEFISYLHGTTLIRNTAFPGLRLKKVELKNRQVLNCDFSFGHFEDCVFDSSTIQFTALNHSVFWNCSFVDLRGVECVFACSSFVNCSFEGSDLVQNNFNGCSIHECKFDRSDLMYSRFISSEIKGSSFVDCNLKAAMFPNSILKEVSFKYSNREEAIFDFNENRRLP